MSAALSAIICTMTGPSVTSSPESSASAGTWPFGLTFRKVVTVFQLLGAQVDLDQVIGQTGLEKRDMGESEQAPGE